MKHQFTFPKKLLATAVIASLAVLSGCDDDDSAEVEVIVDPTYGAIRVIHASPNAPAVNVSVDGDDAILELDYAQSSGFATLETGSYDIAVEGIIPGGNVEVINVEDFPIDEDAMTTVIAVGNVFDIEPLVVMSSETAPGNDQVSLVVTHAAPMAPAVDIFLTAPTDDITNMSPAFNFEFKNSIDVGAVAAGEVRIRAAVDGTVVYDSGTVDLSGFAGQKLQVTAIAAENQVEADASPVKLLVANDTDAIEIRDASTGAGARVVHASPDAASAAGGPVEVWATAAILGDTPVELIASFDYTDIFPLAGDYAGVPGGDYVFDVSPDGAGVGGSVFTSGSVTLEAGMEYSVIATGRVTSSPAFTLLPTGDANRAIATQASVKVVHGAPAAGDVDVYVTVAGEFSVDQVESEAAGDPLLDEFAFGTITDYVAVAPGPYDIRVVAGGLVAINVEGVQLDGGSVSTVIARGPSEPAGEPTDFGVIVLTN
jgi:hypothetical protein